MKGAEAFMKRLSRVLLKRLNVNEITERERNLLMGSLRINMNYYPVCPNPELTVGVGPHSDVSTFTILLQDDVGGLYVRSSTDSSWISVPPMKGSLVINVGDALQIMSNGRYRSVEHRVVASRAMNRISIPLFVNPTPTAVIGPLPEVLADGQKPLYKEVLYSDYVKNFYRNPHEGKKTVEFAQI